MNTRNKPQAPFQDRDGNVAEPSPKPNDPKRPKKANKDNSRALGRHERPRNGNIQGDTVTLLTVHAQRLWKGREEPGKSFIIGFEGLLRRTRNMQGVIDVDPWAEKVHKEMLGAIKDCDALYMEMQKDIEALMPVESGAFTLEMPDLSDELNPETYSVPFRTVLGWQLIELLIKADDLIVDLMTAERSARITASERRTYAHAIQSKMRHAMGFIHKWKYTGVTHKDVAENNEKAQEAITKLGPLNTEENRDLSNKADKAKPIPGLVKRLLGHFKKS